MVGLRRGDLRGQLRETLSSNPPLASDLVRPADRDDGPGTGMPAGTARTNTRRRRMKKGNQQPGECQDAAHERGPPGPGRR